MITRYFKAPTRAQFIADMLAHGVGEQQPGPTTFAQWEGQYYATDRLFFDVVEHYPSEFHVNVLVNDGFEVDTALFANTIEIFPDTPIRIFAI